MSCLASRNEPEEEQIIGRAEYNLGPFPNLLKNAAIPTVLTCDQQTVEFVEEYAPHRPLISRNRQ